MRGRGQVLGGGVSVTTSRWSLIRGKSRGRGSVVGGGVVHSGMDDKGDGPHEIGSERSTDRRSVRRYVVHFTVEKFSGKDWWR